MLHFMAQYIQSEDFNVFFFGIFSKLKKFFSWEPNLSICHQQVFILLFGLVLTQSETGGVIKPLDAETNVHPEKPKREIGTIVIDQVPGEAESEELNFQRPTVKPSKEYLEFINFLYRKDDVKPEGQKSSVSKTKRETSADSSAENKIQVSWTLLITWVRFTLQYTGDNKNLKSVCPSIFISNKNSPQGEKAVSNCKKFEF